MYQRYPVTPVNPVTERFVLADKTKNTLRRMTPHFGFNGLGKVVFQRTYSRGDENWADVVIRVIEGMMSIHKNHYVKASLYWDDDGWQKYARKAAISMFEMNWLPPGRGLWMMGTDFVYERGSTALFNCAATDTSEDLVLSCHWMMDMLMNGVGVGFNTDWRGQATVPDKSNPELFVIPDSREGWCDSLVMLMASYIDSKFFGQNPYPKFDYSQVRPKGEPIRGFGGTASGPDPLIKLHQRVEEYLENFCRGYIEVKKENDTVVQKKYGHVRLIADICNAIGACVVAGNVRRSAEICLGDIDDQDFINLKNYTENPERGEIGWMSNNSVVLKKKLNFEDFTFIPEMARRIIDNGEPGMINLHNMQKYGRYGHEQPDEASLVNPCVTADTWVTTSEGARQVKDLLGKPFEAMVDGKAYPAQKGFFKTGHKQVFKLTTIEGFELRATSNHQIMTADNEWVELKDLRAGDKIRVHQHHAARTNGGDELGWLSGFMYGLGTFNHMKQCIYLECSEKNRYNMAYFLQTYLSNNNIVYTLDDYPQQNKVLIRVENCTNLFKHITFGETLNPNIESQSYAFISAFLGGWFDACGSVQGITQEDACLRLPSNDLDSLKIAQRMFVRLGVYSNISKVSQPNEVNKYELTIPSSCFALQTFAAVIWLRDSVKQQQMADLVGQYKRPLYGSRYEATVSTITLDGEEDVYDTTVDEVHAFDANGLVVHNCGEISLCNFELCNLAETFPPRCDDIEAFYEACKFATFYSTTVSLLPTHRPESNAIIAKNRRIGVSVSGLAQLASGDVPQAWGPMNYTNMTTILRQAYKLIKSTNQDIAQRAGVPQSVRVTTVKPSGSISLLAGVTPGVHYPVSRYAIRRVRIGNDSPLVQPLIDAGVKCEKDTYSDNTLVFEFAIDHGNVRPCEEVSPWEQFSLVAMMQRCYADNCVSATVYFDKEKDADDVEKLLAMYIPILKSVSMLPHSGHGYAQAPYEPITKEQYDVLRASYTEPDFGTVKDSVPVGSKYCSNGSCEI